MTSAARSFIFAIGAATALAFSHLLESSSLQGGFLAVVSAALGVIMAAVVEWMMFRLPLRYKRLRHVLDKRSALEGLWLIDVPDQRERPYALARVEYHPESGEYSYSGIALDESYRVRATWQSATVNIDLSHNQLLHIGEGTIIEDDGVSSVRNLGVLNFQRDAQRGLHPWLCLLRRLQCTAIEALLHPGACGRRAAIVHPRGTAGIHQDRAVERGEEGEHVGLMAANGASVAVSCGSSGEPSAAVGGAMRGLADGMTQPGMRFYFGASTLGLMGRMLDEARRAGLWVGGVTSEALSTVSSVPDDLDELVLAPNLFERRRLLIEETDYVVFLPGGLGTLDELAGALLLRQLGRLDHPVGLLDPDGFYDRLVESVDRMHADGYMAASADSLLVQEPDPEVLLDRLAKRGPEPPVKWPGMDTKLG